MIISRTPTADGSVQKRRLYFNEFNVLMEGSAYLPLVSGLLRCYAETKPVLQERYEFMPFLFYRDRLASIVNRYENPGVAAFSCSMWNEQINLRVAEEVKRRYPECLIVFGGANVPHHPEQYFREHPFIDVAVKGEGEEAFAEILERALDTRDFSGILNVAYRHPETGACVVNCGQRPQPRDLDCYPSPYLEGGFEPLMAEGSSQMRFQAIIETNRGCPFLCTFCFWGQGGLSTKYRFHSLERVKAIIDWCGEHKIEYVFNADSNFGMHPRDYQIAEFLVEAKSRLGYPDKFRTCFGKNTDERIYKVAQLLHEHGLEKGITLARQSNDEEVLKNIKRQNIKLETYKSLQFMFNESNIPVYTELILGLPGETYESWLRGIDDILNSGIRNQLFVYMCQVLTNTELADPESLERFKIRTVRIPLAEIHGGVRPGWLETEYEDIVIETDSMSTEDWRRMAKLSWVMQVLHSLKLGYFLMVYLHERYGTKHTDFLRYVSEERMPAGTGGMLRAEIRSFEGTLNGILAGKDRGQVMPGYGEFYWDVEEASLIRISERLPEFYAELLAVAKAFLSEQAIPYSEEELEEVVEYQRLRIPLPSGLALAGPKVFRHNLPEYFEHSYTTQQVSLRRSAQALELVEPKDYRWDRKSYARETILWGRKSGTMLTKIRWHDLEVSGAEAHR